MMEQISNSTFLLPSIIMAAVLVILHLNLKRLEKDKADKH